MGPVAAQDAEQAPAAERTPAAPFSQASPFDAGTTLEPSSPPDMLPVPGGAFTMGANGVGELDEQPQHQVTLAGFLLDKLEVTNADYRACVEAKACAPYRDGVAASMKLGTDDRFRGPTQPVVGVSWFDAKAYCEWRGKRLPREAEWEKAARGAEGRTYVWGEAKPDPLRLACFAGSVSGATMPVGSFPDGAGPYGHLDLAGNVWEWVEDLYDPYAYQRVGAARGEPGTCEQILLAQDELRRNKRQGYTGTNPIPSECERVLRGGAFNYHARGLRASNRVHHPGTWRLLVAGFRCAKDLPDGR